ncbi:MAG: hypothetical protein FWG13_01540 [Leptospirales bacterium]|nr:hypothetical protein [Leptospirales bacterium]
MTKKNITLAVGFIIAAIFFGIYVDFRRGSVEKNYIAQITESSNSIENLAKEYLAGTDKSTFSSYQMRSLLSSVIETYPETMLAAISDSNYKIKEVNRTKFVTEQIFSNFQSEYSSGAIAVPNSQTPVSRDYHYKRDGKELSSVMYIFVKDIGQYKFAIAYPFVLDAKVLTRLGLEIFLIIILVVIISSFVYMSLSKKYPDREPGQRRRQAGQETRNDNAALNKPFDLSSGDDMSAIIAGIAEKSGASSIFLYSKDNSSAMSSIYGQNNGSVVEPNKVLGESIVKELSRASAFLTNKAATLILPIKDKGTLTAALELKREQPFSRIDIRQIKTLSQGLIGKIPARETLRSSGSYKDALVELTEKYHLSGSDFSVVFISCFDEMGALNHTQRDIALQFILPEIKKYIGQNDKIFEYDEYIALLMEDTGSSFAKLTAQKIKEILSKFRFKVDERQARLVKPVFSIASTDSGMPPEKLTAHALKGIAQK